MKIHTRDFLVAEGGKVDLKKWLNEYELQCRPTKVHGISFVTVRGRDVC